MVLADLPQYVHSYAFDMTDLIARYRLSPQFPFPCGLLDCLAAYLHLLTLHSPEEIVVAGDSAGAGMILRHMNSSMDTAAC